jgi:hypothetical protein
MPMLKLTSPLKSTQRKLQLIINNNDSHLVFTWFIKLDSSVQNRPN